MKIVHKKKEFTRPELEGNLIADDEETKFNTWKAANGKLVEDETKENLEKKVEDNSEFLDGSKETEQPVLTTVNNTDTNGVEVNPESVSPEQVQLPNIDNNPPVDTNVIPAADSTSTISDENKETKENLESSENDDNSTITALKDLIVSLTSKIDDMDNKITSLSVPKEDVTTGEGEDNLLPEEPSTETTTTEEKPEIPAEPTTTSETPAEPSTSEPETSNEDLDAEGEDVDKSIPKTEMFKSFCKKNMQLSEKSDFIIGKLIRGKAYQLEEKILTIVNSKIRSAIDEQKQQIRIDNTKK